MTDSLDETVALLGDAGVVLLASKPAHVQKIVITSVLKCIQYWESCGITLDPIQREAVLDSLIAVLVPYSEAIETSITAAQVATARLEDKTGESSPGVYDPQGIPGQSANRVSAGRRPGLLLFLFSLARGNSGT